MKRKSYMRNRGFTSHRILSEKESAESILLKKIRKIIRENESNGKKTETKR